MALCPLCNKRKARRHCPALGRMICTTCCGTKRLVEIRCPDNCVYLLSAKSHPPAIARRQQQQDLAVVAPMLQGLTEEQSRVLLVIASFIARHQPRDFQTLNDTDIADAVGSLASTRETASRGVIYEHRAGTPAARHLADELQGLIDSLAAAGQRVNDADVTTSLRRIERSVREMGPAAGPSSTAYRDLLARLLNVRDAPETGTHSAPSGGLILP